MCDIPTHKSQCCNLKEQELLESDDAKYGHLKEDLHVLIEVEAPKAEAHGRLAAGIAEVQKFLIPVSAL